MTVLWFQKWTLRQVGPSRSIIQLYLSWMILREGLLDQSLLELLIWRWITYASHSGQYIRTCMSVRKCANGGIFLGVPSFTHLNSATTFLFDQFSNIFENVVTTSVVCRELKTQWRGKINVQFAKIPINAMEPGTLTTDNI